MLCTRLVFSILNQDHYTTTDHAAKCGHRTLFAWAVMSTAAALQAGGFDSWRRNLVGNELIAPIENVMDKLEQ